MKELQDLLKKQHTQYMIRMAYIHDVLRWRIKLPWEMMRGRG